MPERSEHIMPDGGGRESLMERLLPEGGAAVLKSKSGRTIRPVVRLCGRDRLGEILALQERVCGLIPDKDTFVLTTPRELAESLELDYCIGAFIGDRLVAFTLMISSRPGPRNLGSDGGAGPGAGRCVTYDTTFVDPEYGGYGLQRFFIELKDRLAIELGAERAYATVSPSNTASLANLLGSGFAVVGEKTMYGGFGRYILCKPLAGPAGGCSPAVSPTSEEREVFIEERHVP